MWVSNEKRYYEKSLRTKRRAEAIDKVEEMYFDLQKQSELQPIKPQSPF